MSPRDYYAMLQVSPVATQEVIHAAYRALMKLHHSDPNGGDDQFTRDLNDAYEILGNPNKRARYDRERASKEGELIGGQYRLVKRIAEGGYGRTYLGEHALTGLPVCIKDCSSINPDLDAVLIEEAKVMGNLRHFAIPSYQNLLPMQNGRLALVMSYIPGPTLEEVVKRHGRLDPEHVAWISERVLNTLKYMHYHGGIHGDLKPHNIIIQPEDHTIVIVDYGLSLLRPGTSSQARGFTRYFSPPEAVEFQNVSPESDFYSLGMTMVFGLGGSYEFIESKRVPENVPDALCSFISKLIVRDPNARPNWKKEDLCETIGKVRVQAFGNRHSDMKPLPV